MSVSATIAVSVVCLDLDKKEVLIVTESPEKGSFINLPSGHLEMDESPFDGAMRELEEETGIKIIGTDETPDPLIFAGTTLFTGKNEMNYFTMVFACEKFPDQIARVNPGDSVVAVEWMSMERLNKLKDRWRNPLIGDRINMATDALRFARKNKNGVFFPRHRPV